MTSIIRYNGRNTQTHPVQTPTFSPSYDNKIFRKFSIRTIESKRDNKVEFQKELGWVAEPKLPLLCLPAGLSAEQNGGAFDEILSGILALDCQLVVRGIGSEKYGALFTRLENEQKHRIKILPDEENIRRKMYAASDMSLFFAPDETELGNCLAYGVIPVSITQDTLKNYDPAQEDGNAFTADPLTQWSFFAALVRAIETYKLPYDWRTIQKHAMETVREK
jgi:starch synthase